MYYKITNTESKVYQELHALRTKEQKIEKGNRESINDKLGFEFKNFLGNKGQQNFDRTTQYAGFCFPSSQEVDPKVWIVDKKYPAIHVPNKKTKAGREMHQFLFNGLQKSHYADVFEILGLETIGKFTFPYVEICKDAILVFLGDNQEPSLEDVVEITKKEFEQILGVNQ